MILYITKEEDVHSLVFCKATVYETIPRVGEKIVAEDTVYTVTAVYHNLDLQEIKIVVKND